MHLHIPQSAVPVQHCARGAAQAERSSEHTRQLRSLAHSAAGLSVSCPAPPVPASSLSLEQLQLQFNNNNLGRRAAPLSAGPRGVCVIKLFVCLCLRFILSHSLRFLLYSFLHSAAFVFMRSSLRFVSLQTFSWFYILNYAYAALTWILIRASTQELYISISIITTLACGTFHSLSFSLSLSLFLFLVMSVTHSLSPPLSLSRTVRLCCWYRCWVCNTC